MTKDIEKANRAFIILSDIEMSSGGPTDDFPQTDYLVDFFRRYNEDPYKNIELDLVFNGDTFDFLKTAINGEYPHLVDEDVANKKFDLISRAHLEFFEGLREFIESGTKARRVHFIVGNHDPEILFPSIQNKITALCGGSGQVLFPGFELHVGDLHIEHGSQYDSLFHIPVERPFIRHKDHKILNMPWASVTLLNVFMPLHPYFHDLDRVKPKKRLFEEIPKLKDYMLAHLWDYWTKNYIKDYLKSSDPLKKLSWSMIKEAFRRSFVFNPEVEMTQYFQRRMARSSDTRIYVIGHAHDPRIWSYGNRKVLQSGCMRNEFVIDDEGVNYEPVPKSYIEVLFKNNKVLTSNLLETEGPEIAKEFYPKPIKSYISLIEEKLGPVEKVDKEEKKEVEAKN